MKTLLTGICGLLLCSVAIQDLAAQEKGLLYAHRGGAFEQEENTLSAFRTCYEKGIRGFETDIRMTKDGVLVVLHDDALDRTHNATGPVEHKTAEELKQIRSKKGESFLFLEELLQYLADKPGLYLELEMKTSNKTLYPDQRVAEFCQKLHAAVKADEPAESFYYFTSFDERPIKQIRQLDDQARLIYITGGSCTPEFVEQAKALKVNRIACRMEGTTRAQIRAAQKAGFPVNGWPGHTLQDYHLAVGLGVDAICSDIPLTIQEYLEKTR